VAQVRVTATWHKAIPPTVPLYWRDAPAHPPEAYRPAVMILRLAQQAVHHVTAYQAGLPPGEARSDPRHQVIEQARMPVMVYRGSSGCRAIVVFCKPP
jgi:hypothetical protein